MRRFQGKSVLVVVTALLLLGDMFGIRSSVPRLEKDTLPTESVALAAQAILPPIQAIPENPVVHASAFWFALSVEPIAEMPQPMALLTIQKRQDLPTPRLALPPRARTTALAAPTVAQGSVSPGVWLGSTPLLPTGSPAARPGGALPPRRWSPPWGIAYIQWWTA